MQTDENGPLGSVEFEEVCAFRCLMAARNPHVKTAACQETMGSLCLQLVYDEPFSLAWMTAGH